MRRLNETDHLLSGGSVLIARPVIFRPIEDYKPPTATALLVVIDDPEQDEFVQEFAQVDQAGNWSFISGDPMPMPDGHRIVYWAEEPRFPKRSDLQGVSS